MIVKLSRIFIIFVVILVASVILPDLYTTAFKQRVVAPMAFYSPVLEDFLIGESDANYFYYRDPQHKKYTRDEADLLLPLVNYRVLLGKGKMPDSVKGKPINIDTLRRNNLFIRIRPNKIYTPVVDLYPLFESKPARFKLTMPEHFFTIDKQMEFYEAATNQLDSELTEKFTRALLDKGFTFPAKKYFGNPSTRKAFDEGYFIVDATNKFFQIKMIKGEPFCKNIPLPKDFNIIHMSVYENSLREFYGLIINDKDELYFLLYDNYKLQKLPVENYDSASDQIFFRANIFYRQITLVSDDRSVVFVTDRKYNSVAKYSEKVDNIFTSPVQWVYDAVFPFSLSFYDWSTSYMGFYFSSYSLNALILNILLMIGLLFFNRYRGKNAIKKWYDFAIVLVTGIYGFIAVLVYENTDL